MTKGPKKRLLFLCTGNSCRSQMAEGWGKRLLTDFYEVSSAGLEAHGVNPRAIRVMQEASVDISDQKSNTIDLQELCNANLIITLCGHAEENCPITPPTAVRLHWPLPDPAKATGTEEEILAQFRAVRDEIRSRIEALAAAEAEEVSQ